jgi:FimV-like protein
MLRFSHSVFLLSLLAGTSATAQSGDVSDAELAARFTINGVLISADNRIALINDQLSHVGDFVGDAQVVAIESNLVHLHVANRSFSMRVGSALIRESGYVVKAATRRADANAPMAPGEAYGPVRPGETLSEIAQSLTNSPRDRQWLMAQLYAHNPQAFGGTMDLLYAGARLTMPGAGSTAQTEAFALASLHDEGETPAAAPPKPASHGYGPVQPGETLSEIALNIAIDGITLNQMMLALFTANPASFGGNLNLLYAGEFLEIPEIRDGQLHSPEAAQREVDRQATVWQASLGVNNST